MAEKEVPTVSTTIVSAELAAPSSTWKGWLWDSADVSKEERRLLLKLLKVGCLAAPSIIDDSLL
jgi:MFS transporter, ACS family, pantothenate transporter